MQVQSEDPEKLYAGMALVGVVSSGSLAEPTMMMKESYRRRICTDIDERNTTLGCTEPVKLQANK